MYILFYVYIYDIMLFPARWMEACLGEELPAPTELEEGLRNGVWLAKLAHHFSPNTTPLRKIYDSDQNRYKVCHSILHCMIYNLLHKLDTHTTCKIHYYTTTLYRNDN